MRATTRSDTCFDTNVDPGDLLGAELGPSSWIEVSQERIDSFADATGDSQWIHVDRERASAGPFGATIAHGFLTLSLLVPMLYEVLPRGDATVVNYGLDRVRFPAPVRSGSRIRACFHVVQAAAQDGGARLTIAATVECEGVEKPVCVAELIVLLVT